MAKTDDMLSISDYYVEFLLIMFVTVWCIMFSMGMDELGGI